MVSPYDFMSNNVSPAISNTWAVNTCKENTNTAETVPLKVIYDWLGFTFLSNDINVSNVLDWFHFFLGIPPENFQEGRRFYQGYADSFVFENINIYYNGAYNQGIHIDFTGQGCRYIEAHFEKLQIHAEKNITQDRYFLMSWNDLLRYLYYVDDINITRLDIAADDFDGYINVSDLFYKSLQGELKMRFRTWRPDGRFNSNGKTNGITLNYGSQKSQVQLTIYEKNKQLGLDYHWTRLELQFGKKRSSEVVKEILESGNEIGIIYAGILKHYITFLDRGKDSNKARWETSEFWSNLLKGIKPLRIATALPDSTIVKNRYWLGKQYSRTMARLFFAFQDLDDNWLRDLVQEGFSKLDKNDKRMIEEYRRTFENDYLLDEQKKESQKEKAQDNTINI